MSLFASLRSTRRVLRLAGSDVFHFLQGLTTNDVLPLSKKDSPSSLYSAFLSPQGRILSDVFFHREGGGGGGAGGEREEASPSSSSSSSSPPPPPPFSSLFAEVDASAAPQLLSLLRRYRLRAQVDIDDVGEEFEVFVRGFGVGNGGSGEGGGRGGGGGGGAEVEWPRDPRGLRALGLRAVLPSDSAPTSSSSSDAAAASASRAYAAARYALGVAEGAELELGRGTPLEANLDGLNGVSFTKGCYVGQEPVARAHFRGAVHKRVVPVTVLSREGSESESGGGGERGGAFSSPSSSSSSSSSSSLIGRDVVVLPSSSSSSSHFSSSVAAAAITTKPARSAGRLLALCRESGTGLALLRLSSVPGVLLPAPGEIAAAAHPRLALAPREGEEGQGGEGEGGGKGAESGLVLVPSRPQWWPQDWGRD